MTESAQKKQPKLRTAYSAPEDSPEHEEKVRVFGLVRHLVDDMVTLVRKELALAGSEISQSVSDTKKGAASMVSGAVVLNSGFIVLLAAATLGLAEVMPGWAAALIVGGIVTIVGVIMLLSGKKKFEASSFKPERTIEDLRKDREMVRRSVQ